MSIFTDLTAFKSSVFKCNRKNWFGRFVRVDLIGNQKLKYSKRVQKNC